MPQGIPASLMLTPAHQTELEEEVVMVGIEDFDHKPIEVVALNAHPGEAAQEEEVQEQPPSSADCLTAAGSQVFRDEEGDIQQEDGTQQVHVDVHARDLVSLLAPAEARRGKTSQPCLASVLGVPQHPTAPHGATRLRQKTLWWCQWLRAQPMGRTTCHMCKYRSLKLTLHSRPRPWG